MKVIPVINQLKAECPSFDSRVEPAQSLEALPDDEVKNSLPMAFVYSADEDSPGNEVFGDEARINQRFGVIIVCRNIDLDAGSEPLEDLRQEVRAALAGYQPTAFNKPVTWVNGRIITTSKRMVWWADTFETAIYE